MSAQACGCAPIAGAMTDLLPGQHLDAMQFTDSPDSTPGGANCSNGCGGSGLLGGGPEPGSVEASGSPADLTAPVG
jgi:hypothetical protein